MGALAEDMVGKVNDRSLAPLSAAKLLMNTFYQSCGAAAKIPYDTTLNGEMRGYEMIPHPFNGGRESRVKDLKAAQKSQYYLDCKSVSKPAPKCKNLCATPPSYLWGGKGIYKQSAEGIVLDLFHSESSIEKLSGHPGLDCSGFINATFATAGLRIDPELSPAKAADTVGAKAFMSFHNCFSPVTPRKANFFHPGDVIAWKKHIVMVDSSGIDPFALASIHSVEDCNDSNLDPAKFNLVVINSRGGIDPPDEKSRNIEEENPQVGVIYRKNEKQITGVGVGISRIKFGDFILSYPVEVLELAKSACFANFGEDLPLNNIKIIRHKLADPSVSVNAELDDSCRLQPEERITLEGKKCLEKCAI